MSELKLTEIASRIHAHLQRFAADATINAPSKTWGTRPYYMPSAVRGGSFVVVRYVNYQSKTNLPRDKALAYLAALDTGFVGTHWQAEKLLAAQDRGAG